MWGGSTGGFGVTAVESILSDQGILGAVIIVLLGVCGALWSRLTTVQDAHLADVKEHAGELAEVAREASRSMDGLRQVLEVKRNV